MKQAITILILLSGISFAQHPGWTQYDDSKRINSTEVFEDEICFGTITGLVKFNKISGQTTKYNTANSPISNNNVDDLMVDQLGGLWIRTSENITETKYQYLLNESWSDFYDIFPELSQYQILRLIEDNYHNLWARTDSGIIKISGDDITIYHDESFYNHPIGYKPLAADSSGNIYFADAEGFFKFDGEEFTYYNNMSTGYGLVSIMEIEVDNSDATWIATVENGLYKFSSGSLTRYDEIGANYMYQIRSMAFDESNHAWFGLDYGGVVKFDGTVWTHYLYQTGDIIIYEVNSLIFDNSGKLWIGSVSEGVYSLYNNVWQSENIFSFPIDIYSTSDIFMDSQNRLWYAGYKSVGMMKDGEWSLFKLPDYPIHDPVKQFAESNDGAVWMASEGLLKYDAGDWIEYNKDNSGLHTNALSAVAVDGGGEIWIGTQGEGLVTFNGVDWNIFVTSNSDIPSNKIRDISIDGNNRVWVATDDNGAAYYSNGDWTLYNTSNSPLPGNHISKIAFSENTVWFATVVGLAKLENMSDWFTYTTNNSMLPNNIIEDIGVGSSDRIWVATREGACRIDGEQWSVYNSNNSGLPDDYVKHLWVDNYDKKWFSTLSVGLTSYEDENTIPVELISFSLIYRGDTPYLRWSTASELNNHEFIISGAADGSNFNQIGRVAGKGSSTEINEYSFPLKKEGQYNTYRLSQIDFDGSERILETLETGNVSNLDFKLMTNYPNPFNPTTNIEYYLKTECKVLLKITDIRGAHIKTLVNEKQNAGYHNITFRGTNLASGVYLYRLQVKDKKGKTIYLQGNKMLLLK
ncbi:MAG: hypothetical protein SCALA702_00470 [Melioribacteraceae bacterium]|nr:MAG: hypothetical protein SCALA702_00470 [Melioribacteraceae bacterium]